MRVPVSWLRDYVDVPWPVEELAERLTMSGLEVEAIERVGARLEGVVTARIRAIEPHPKADRLVVCRVDAGGGEPLQIVCGASNMKEGDVVPLAKVGARLPGGMQIRKAKLRGVESQGMLCSGAELEANDDASGLMILPGDTEIGRPVSELLGGEETVLEIEVTPNRPDCLSMIGVAREVAVLTGGELRLPEVSFAEEGPPVETLAAVDLEAPDLCPRYTARVVQDVRLGPSPLWMRRRLEAAGLRAINNLVDVTNYVLLELGQPLHAFDLNLLADRRIVVRRAAPGERIRLIDESEHELDPGMLVIADASEPVALAGIMGGAGSEIRETTSEVLVESAFFHPPSIRATSKRLGLSTESSYRFERGVDLEGVDFAGRRAVALLLELAGGRAARGGLDLYPKPYEPRTVRCRAERVSGLLGMEPDPGKVTAVFRSLGLDVVAADAEGWTVNVPARRVDLEEEVDLIEEIARIEGIDAIPPAPLAARFPTEPSSDWWYGERNLRARCAAAGLHEVMNYSLLSPQALRTWGFDDEDRWVRLVNPLSEDQGVLRPSLVPGIVGTVARNLYRETHDVRIFELGRVFERPGRDAEPAERRRLAFALTGRRHPGAWENALRGEILGFYDLKGVVVELLRPCRFERLTFRPAERKGFSPGRVFEVLGDGTTLGFGGELNEAWREELRSAAPVLVAELDADALLDREIPRPVYRPLPRFPSVSLDVALVVDRSVSHERIVETIRSCPNRILEKIELFDIFTSKKLGADRKSMAYSLTYRDPERSLTVEEANAVHEKVKETLRKKLHCDIRQ